MNKSIKKESQDRPIVLETKKLTMNFSGLVAVNNLDMVVRKNDLFGIIGPNGAGKTTLFNMITKHTKPTSGDIIYNGKSIKNKHCEKVVKMGIARTFQNIRLFTALTVRDNVLAGMHMHLNVNWFFAMLGIGGYRKKNKEMMRKSDILLEKVGLLKYANEEAGCLSYGLQRRLEIARALATEPKLLLLDEPAAGMNPQEVNELIDFIREIRDEFNLTILVIEHHMHLVMNLCENIVAINYGEKIAEGNAEMMQNDQKVIEAYLGVDKNVED